MQCVEFDQTINELLDARRELTDRALREHAMRCPACSALLEAYQTLEHAMARLPVPRSRCDLIHPALEASRPARRRVNVLARAAAVAAALALAVLVPMALRRQSPNPARPSAQLVEKKPLVSPTEAFVAAGETWWSFMRDTIQPFTQAPQLLAPPDFEALGETWEYEKTLLSWEQVRQPLSDATSSAMELFRTAPIPPIHPPDSIDSAS